MQQEINPVEQEATIVLNEVDTTETTSRKKYNKDVAVPGKFPSFYVSELPNRTSFQTSTKKYRNIRSFG